MVLFGLSTTARLEVMGVIVLGLWVLLSAATATYGANRGFRFWPLLACGLLIGFPWVLLAVTVATPLLDRVALATDDRISQTDTAAGAASSTSG